MVRPNKGPEHVAALAGDPQAKRRVRAILATMCGISSVLEACDELGIGPTQWANLRIQMLEGCIAALGPRPLGRPPHVTTVATDELEATRQRLAELERENVILRARLELATLPATRETLRSKSRNKTATPRSRSASVGRAVP